MGKVAISSTCSILPISSRPPTFRVDGLTHQTRKRAPRAQSAHSPSPFSRPPLPAKEAKRRRTATPGAWVLGRWSLVRTRILMQVRLRDCRSPPQPPPPSTLPTHHIPSSSRVQPATVLQQRAKRAERVEDKWKKKESKESRASSASVTPPTPMASLLPNVRASVAYRVSAMGSSVVLPTGPFLTSRGSRDTLSKLM
jgi:hypothetical protein